jgi:hypothetical protein
MKKHCGKTGRVYLLKNIMLSDTEWIKMAQDKVI